MAIWGAIIPAAIAAISAIAGNASKKKQNKQAMALQQENNKELMEINHQNQLDTFNKTGYTAQMKQLKEAGLNPALMYGSAGGGGQATSAGGGGAGLTQPVDNSEQIGQLGIVAAQTGLLKAQTKDAEAGAAKKAAEAEKIGGVDTRGAAAGAEAQEFTNRVNSLITEMGIAKNYQWAADKVQIESEKANAEWETYKASGYQGRSFDDEGSPIAKAMKAGFDKVSVDLENAKKDGNLKDAEKLIKMFEANLTKQGLSPNSPWYVKFMADLAAKVGLEL